MRLGDGDLGLLAQRLVGGDEQGELGLERHLERVDGARPGPLAARGRDGCELDCGPRDERGRLRDGDGFAADSLGLGGGDDARRGEAPRAVADRPDAEAEAVGALDRLDDARGDLELFAR